MRRRDFITLVGGAAALPVTAAAQGRVARIGFLAQEPPANSQMQVRIFRDALRERGYVEGRNLVIEYCWPTGSFEESAAAVDELVRKVDVILAWATPSVLAARRATSSVPIVMVAIGDPLGLRLVDSFARPGGNVTGFANLSRDLSGKIVQLLTEVVPDIRRIGIVRNPYNPSLALILRETEEAVRALGSDVRVVNASTKDEFARAFVGFKADDVGAVVLLADPSVLANGKQIAELAQQARLPTIFQRRESVEAGGLLSYGASLPAQLQRAALYIDRILKGEKPADLPVEQPTKFELVINLKTAKALGLAVPPTLLARADEVIE